MLTWSVVRPARREASSCPPEAKFSSATGPDVSPNVRRALSINKTNLDRFPDRFGPVSRLYCGWFFCLKTPLDEHCNLSHCKIEIVLSCSDTFTLELSLIALKATIGSESYILTLVYWGHKLFKCKCFGSKK